MISKTRVTIFMTLAVLIAAAGGYHLFSGRLPNHLAYLNPAAGLSAPSLVAHKALYDIKTVSVRSGSGISNVEGSMYYEQDDTCDAWSTDQRFSMAYKYPNDLSVNNTSHYVAWESKDGNRFEFSSELQENGTVAEKLRGAVEHSEAGQTKAIYSRPDGVFFELPEGYLLPMSHTIKTIQLARAGKRSFHGILFDGTDKEGPIAINTFISSKVSEKGIIRFIGGDQEKIDPELLSSDAWKVRMAVFPLTQTETQTPAYEMDIVLHDNGVVSYALVDYGLFEVEQKLKAASMLPVRSCP